jgi:hypothetical protein
VSPILPAANGTRLVPPAGALVRQPREARSPFDLDGYREPRTA